MDIVCLTSLNNTRYLSNGVSEWEEGKGMEYRFSGREGQLTFKTNSLINFTPMQVRNDGILSHSQNAYQ